MKANQIFFVSIATIAVYLMLYVLLRRCHYISNIPYFINNYSTSSKACGLFFIPGMLIENLMTYTREYGLEGLKIVHCFSLTCDGGEVVVSSTR